MAVTGHATEPRARRLRAWAPKHARPRCARSKLQKAGGIGALRGTRVQILDPPLHRRHELEETFADTMTLGTVGTELNPFLFQKWGAQMKLLFCLNTFSKGTGMRKDQGFEYPNPSTNADRLCWPMPERQGQRARSNG